MKGSWDRISTLPPRAYVCRHETCRQAVESDRGWPFLMHDQYETWFIYICPRCQRPTFFDHYERQQPG